MRTSEESSTTTGHSLQAQSSKSAAQKVIQKSVRLAELRIHLCSSTSDAVITDYMADKIAGSGLSYSNLRTAHERDAQHGIALLLSERSRNGRPRITANKKVIASSQAHFSKS